MMGAEQLKECLEASMDSVIECRRHIVGKFLADKRVKAGLSQRDVARHFGWTTSQYVSNLERGVAQLSVELMPRFAQLLGVPAKEFIAVIENYEATVLELRMRKMQQKLKTRR